MATVLVADVLEGIKAIRNILPEDIDVVGSDSLDEATHLLHDRQVDLVVCGLHFSESRMYDFLRKTKADPQTKDIPFVGFRDMDSALSPIILEGLVIASAALGAMHFVDLYELKLRHGLDRADEAFRRILLAQLDRQ